MKTNYTTLEFNLIQDKLKQYCASLMAKEKVDELTPFKDLDDLRLFQDDVQVAMHFIYAYGRLPLSTFTDIEPLIQKADKGGCLFPEEFLIILQLLNNVQEVLKYLENEKVSGHFYDYMSMLYYPKDLVQQIQKCLDPSGKIYDHASRELFRIRQQITSIEIQIRKKIASLKNQNKDYLSHDVISTRNDHLVLPVKDSYKNQIQGIQHGQSASKHTVFIEPIEIVNFNSQLAFAKEEEQQEIHRILLALTKQVNSYQRILKENLTIMIDIDLIFALGTYGKVGEMIMPTIDDNYQGISLLQAGHPLIDSQKVVPNDLVLEKPEDILLISGSNTGGKTVALKTAGLLALMAICGLPVPAKEAKLALFDEIYVDLGDEQSIAQSLSTFSSHMSRLVTICNQVSANSLVIIDEICSGTDPQEGESLAQALLIYLHQKQCLTLASTHYSALKQFAKASTYIKIAAVEFDQERMLPTYRLIHDSIGNSYAIEISQHLGLKPTIIEQAYHIKECSLTQSQKLLEQLQREKDQVLQEKNKLQQLELQAKQKEQQYQQLINNYQKNKDELIEQAKEEANLYLEEAKMKTQEILQSLQGQIKPHVAIKAKKQLDDAKYQKQTQTINNHHQFVIGDMVKVMAVNRDGEVIAINKKGGLTISMGGLKINVQENEVEFKHGKIKQRKETTNVRSLRKMTTQSFELNIVGLRYEEAMIQVDKFIDNALVNNYSMVRIIHGMGTGVLRKGVRKLLDKNKYVKSYRDGGANEGGLGATLVYFE